METDYQILLLDIIASIRKLVRFPVIKKDNKIREVELFRASDVLFPLDQLPTGPIFICFGCAEALKNRIYILEFGTRLDIEGTCKSCESQRNFGFMVNIHCDFCHD